MPIYSKSTVAPVLEELDTYYKKLREQVSGIAPSPDLAQHYMSNPETFEREFTQIDLDQLNTAVAHFKVSVDSIKKLKLKEKQAKKRPSS